MSSSLCTVLITGSCSGIGLAAARAFASQGDTKVIICGVTNTDLEFARSSLEPDGLEAHYHTLDLRTDISVRELRGRLEAEGLRPSVLINNAAVMPPFAPEPSEPDFFSIDSQQFLEVLEVNVLGTMRMCRAFVPWMIEDGYGRVVNVASEAASLSGMLDDPWPYSPSYRISKVGVNALTRLLARQLKGEGVLVNSVCPGWVRTRMGGSNALLEPEDAIETMMYLARLPADGPSGGFFRDMRPYGFPNQVAW